MNYHFSNLYRKIITNPLAYIHNRWINPSDRVIIKHHDYPQGHYHDSDSVMLYALFQLVVDFVEIECGSLAFNGHHYETCGQKWNRRLRELPFFHWFFLPVRNVRRGLHHLRWEMNLKDHPSQTEAAKDMFALYRFWKHERPARIDPFEAYHNLREGKDWRGPRTQQEEDLLKQAMDLEDKYEKEDTEMLVKIVKVRGCMWT